MDERCPNCSCDVSEKLENLQVLRHIMMMKKKEFEEIKKQRCTAHEDKTRSKSTADHNKTRRK